MSTASPANHVLTQLVHKAGTSPNRKRDVMLGRKDLSPDSADPYPFHDSQKKAALHERLREVASQGWISLDWKHSYEGELLDRVRLVDAEALAEHLGLAFTPRLIDDARNRVTPMVAGHWLAPLVEEVFEAWGRGKKKYGLSIDDPAKLFYTVEAIARIEAHAACENVVMDYRQFGARQLGHSKALNPLIAPIAGLFKAHWGRPELTAEDVLAELNLVKIAHPVLLSGPVVIEVQGKMLDASVPPYVGTVPSLDGRGLSMTSVPSYLMTIENLSSFTEYVTAISDGGIVLYTGGYPARRVQDFYRLLLDRTECPVYHWGDSDVHGFRILKVLQGLAGDRVVHPHDMATPQGRPFTDSEARQLRSLRPVNANVDALLNLVEQGQVTCLEQEMLPARPPEQVVSLSEGRRGNA